ncbi:MAG: hypothetical protein RIF39_07270 [Cyclobacteriaceae bacterium]
MKDLRKYSKHLIGYSMLVWVPGFFFLNTEILIGHILFPISAVMVILGTIGWISKPRTKFIRTGYATQFDVFLGWLWERFAPKWFTFWLLFGIISSNFFSYSMFEQKLEWKNVKSALMKSDSLSNIDTNLTVATHERLVSNNEFISYEVTFNGGNGKTYELTNTKSYEFVVLKAI